MKITKLLPVSLRTRRRPRCHDDSAEVFRTFIHLLARMQAHARGPATVGADMEQG